MITSELDEHLEVFQAFAKLSETLLEICNVVANAVEKDKKILFIGNGGSAADAQHLAAEFSGRFRLERRGLPGLALTTDTSALTAISNDYGYENVFVRQLEALGRPGDVLIGISTSGNSPNVLMAMEYAFGHGMETIGFTGRDGGKMKNVCHYNLVVPSKNTARIQEMHILAGHIICSFVDNFLLKNK